MIHAVDQTIATAYHGTLTGRGASLLVVDEGRFLLAARPPIVTPSRTLINLTGVGGWLEPGESFSGAAMRETTEETGVSVTLINLHDTLIVHSPDVIEDVCIVGELGPAAIVYCRMGTPPFDPWSEEYDAVVPVTVYAGSLSGRPHVIAPDEHPFFLWLYPEQLIALADGELPLAFLLSDGAKLEGDFKPDNERVVVRLGDSIPALLSALGPAAFGFLGRIARLSQPARVE
ncbi:MAG: NUDIX domain-containing protein [Thermomicrobiales bacterium]